MHSSEIPHWPTESSTGWCTTRIAARCVGTPCVKRMERRRQSECIGGPKAVEKPCERRPWKSQERFPLSHSFNNNKLDDRDHFQQNAKTSVASLRGLIGSSRNTDRHHSGMLIDFIGIPTQKTGAGRNPLVFSLPPHLVTNPRARRSAQVSRVSHTIFL